MAAKNPDLIYVIAGKEGSLVSARCEKLLDELVDPEQRAMCLYKPDADKALASDVLDELRTLPFLADRRVVLIKNADDFVSKNRDLLESYFDKPCPTGLFILTVSSWPGNTKLAKKLSKVGRLISVTNPKPWQLPDKLVTYARGAHDKNISKAAAELLVELAGENLIILYGEIDKLALFVDSEKAITSKHIESLAGQNRLFNIFAVIDAVLAGNVAKAVDRLRKMFDSDKSAEYTFVGAFAFHFRRMFGAKVLLDKGVGTSDIASRLRIWGNKSGFFAQLRKLSLEQIAANLQQLAKIDYQIKTGQVQAKVAAEQLVYRLGSY